MLGSPIGSSKHIANFLERKLKKVVQLMEKFEQLENPQVAYYLLKDPVPLLESFPITLELSLLTWLRIPQLFLMWQYAHVLRKLCPVP